MESLEQRRLLAVFNVNSVSDTVDAVPGDGVAADASGNTTLRAAVMEANAQVGADTINLPAGVYELRIGGLREDDAAQGDLDVIRDVTILGASAAETVVDASPSGDRVFDLHAAAIVEFRGLTITGGQANNNGSYGRTEDYGGGIRAGFYNELTIAECVITGNSAPNTSGNLMYGLGGAISTAARRLTISDCRFTDNHASNSGGAIYTSGSAAGVVPTVVIRDTTFSGNSAHGGGAIENHYTMTIDNSTFVDNGRDPEDGGNGGAINNQGNGDLTLTNSTVSGNSSAFGGGIINFGLLKVVNGTIFANAASFSGGGIQGHGTIELQNTIIAGNTATGEGPDVYGDVTSLGHNLVGDTTDSSGFGSVGDLLNVEAKLAPLADNGGPTQTHALLPDSPAIDAADTAAAPDTDQRGVARPQGPQADVGAYELAEAGQTYTILASVDGYAEDQGAGDGVFELLDTTASSVRVRNFLDISFGERRGIIEFDLSTIPAGATVTSAQVRLYVNSYTRPPDPLIHLYGYPGDGAVTLSDATADGPLLGSLLVDDLGQTTVPIDAGFIESLVGTGQHAGILLRKLVPEAPMCGFASLEWGAPDTEAMLIVETAAGQAGQIRGTKFNDLDGDGLRGPGEEGLPDWTIYLDRDANGRLDPGETRTITGPSGEYAFADLPPDTYVVAEVVQDGWQQTLPGTQPLNMQWITRAAQAVQGSGMPSLSGDGRFVTLLSDAANLVPGDTNGFADVFVYDRQTDSFDQVSLAWDGSQANDHSSQSTISADGRYVAFLSAATNLVPGDTNGYEDVFVFDRQTDTVQRLSVANDGSQANDDCRAVAISADGRYVAYESAASSLVDGDTNDAADVFVYDRQAETLRRASVAWDGSEAQGYSTDPAISADGRYVAFDSRAPNLVADDTNNAIDVFVHDLQTDTVQRVSVGWDGSQAAGNSLWPAISGDGRYVAFNSGADNLVAEDNNQRMDVFVYDRLTATTERIGTAFDGTEADGASADPAISADGRYVSFSSAASNFVPGDTNQLWDVFVCDRLTGVVRRVNVADDGTQAGDPTSFQPTISGDGQYVAFMTPADGLVPDDNNGLFDVFLSSTEASLLPGTWTVGLSEGRIVENVDFGNRLVPASVVGRHVIYNNSIFDGNDPGANAQDDDAIAPDKQALLPGQTAAFANYTSYTRGINGIMVDVAGLPTPDGPPAAGDYFSFRVGNDDNPAAWQPAPDPAAVTIRPGEGADGSDRVTVVWDDGAIAKQWLQVTVAAGAHTGLISDDVFYFGNAIGECGNSATDTKVNAADMLAARDNPRGFLDPAPIDFNFDFDRDARVNAVDMLIARNNTTHFLNALRLISMPGGKRAGGVESGLSETAPAEPAWLYQFQPTTLQPRRLNGSVPPELSATETI